MIALFDTNVILDVLLDRAPFANISSDLISKVERGEFKGYLGATTITTIHYLASKRLGAKKTEEVICNLLAIFEIAPVTDIVIKSALRMQFPDFEDAVLHEAARQVSAHVIVTRDGKGFRKGSIPAFRPDEYRKILRAGPFTSFDEPLISKRP